MLLNKRTVGATQQPCNTRLGIRVGIEGKWTGIEVVLAINASPFFQGRLLVLFHQRPKSCDFQDFPFLSPSIEIKGGKFKTGLKERKTHSWVGCLSSLSRGLLAFCFNYTSKNIPLSPSSPCPESAVTAVQTSPPCQGESKAASIQNLLTSPQSSTGQRRELATGKTPPVICTIFLKDSAKRMQILTG